jgi:methylglutaconyl-CoA hydratase
MKRAGHYTDDDNRADAADMAEMLWRLKTLPQPTIALVNGAAVGGGLGLISACDIAVAVKDAKFRFSEVHLGLTPATISPHVIEAIGPRWTRALFVTGESFDANFAHQIGLVQYVVEDRNELSETAEHLVKLVFKGAPGAIHDAKALVNDFGGHPITQEIRRDSARRIADRRASEEGKEGLTAFLEKRKPRWAE